MGIWSKLLSLKVLSDFSAGVSITLKNKRKVGRMQSNGTVLIRHIQEK